MNEPLDESLEGLFEAAAAAILLDLDKLRGVIAEAKEMQWEIAKIEIDLAEAVLDATQSYVDDLIAIGRATRRQSQSMSMLRRTGNA
jgi:hypothetical protein